MHYCLKQHTFIFEFLLHIYDTFQEEAQGKRGKGVHPKCVAGVILKNLQFLEACHTEHVDCFIFSSVMVSIYESFLSMYNVHAQ